jgi:hypothetical protein
VSAQVDWSTRGSGHRSFVLALAGCGLTFAAGIAAGLYGRSIPVFSVPFGTAARAYAAWCTDDARVVDVAGDRYYALFTNHYTLVDAGIGLVLTAVTTACMTLVLRIRSVAHDTWFCTPERRSTFFVLGLGAVVWLWMAMIHSLDTDLRRMYFPPCADSIGIPIFANTIFTIFVTPMLILFGWVTTWGFGSLPAPLLLWDADRPVRSWTVTLLFGAATAGTAFVLAESMRSSMSVAAPAFVVIIYLFASTRAALLSPRALVERRDERNLCR